MGESSSQVRPECSSPGLGGGQHHAGVLRTASTCMPLQSVVPTTRGEPIVCKGHGCWFESRLPLF